MKKRILAMLSVAVITAGTIGGVVFANSVDDNNKVNQPIVIQETISTSNPATVEKTDVKATDAVKATNNSDDTNYNKNSANNPSKDSYQDMIKIMRDNGFKDAARYMQTGNYEAMTNYMNNLTQEDFDKMIEIMNNNGYGNKGKMMQSIGREGMIQMHNSMRSVRGSSVNGSSYNNMMGDF